VFVSGSGLLLARAHLGELPFPPTVSLAASYALIGAAAIVLPERLPSRSGPIPPGLGLAIGLAAVLGAAAVTGRPAPMPSAPAAPALGALAALCEEALFRRLAYGRLERLGPAVAIVATAASFALLHVPLYGTTVLPVDLGAGLLFSWQRWAAGTWTVPAATHAAANLLAVIR
jgi:membrane protease YdiL (CAAX protease family)